jgi:hypothetical protein
MPVIQNACLNDAPLNDEVGQAVSRKRRTNPPNGREFTPACVQSLGRQE